jgi:autophagy-related protein 5
LLPEFFSSDPQNAEKLGSSAAGGGGSGTTTNSSASSPQEAEPGSACLREAAKQQAKVKLVRVQGIELDADIPFLWVANNLRNPEHYLHICVYVQYQKTIAQKAGVGDKC